MRFIAVYARVSSRQQTTASQLPELERWVAAYAGDTPVRWFTDKQTGTNMNRPAWLEIEDGLAAGSITKIVVWRMDRLGRTASGLTTLFDQLRELGVDLVSIKDGMDLETPAGRLMANVLASVAQYETEVRSERQMAGVELAKVAGKYTGRKAGTTKAAPQRAVQLLAQGLTLAEVGQALGVSTRTVQRYAG